MAALPFASSLTIWGDVPAGGDFRPYVPAAAARIIDGVHCSMVENGTGF